MSKVERSTSRPLFRWVALGSTAAFLLSSAYTKAWGGPFGGGGNGTPGKCNDADPNDPDCKILDDDDDDDINLDDDDDDDGLSSGEIAAIAVGGLAVGAGLWYLMGRKKSDDGGEEQKATSAGSAQKVTALRLVPRSKTVAAGERDVLDLQARGTNGKWFSVTTDEAASIEVKGDSAGLMRLNGSKNAFALPISTSAAAHGKQVTLVGRYAGLTAQTTVQLQVNGELVSSR